MNMMNCNKKLNLSDNNECGESNGGCQSVCVNTPGSHTCACERGYLLLPDGRSCVGELSSYVGQVTRDVKFGHKLSQIGSKCDKLGIF